MTFLPIVERELREASRRRHLVLARLGFATAGVLVVGVALLLMGSAPRPGGGAGTFRFLTWILFAYALVSGVLLTADCLSAEMREGTLGLMFLTDLRGYDVVLGKLVGRSLTAAYGLLAVVPVLAAAILLGGVVGREFWAGVLACLNTLFLSLTVGMFISSLTREEHRAMAWTTGVMGLLGAVFPAVGGGFGLGGSGLAASLMLFTPWTCVVTAFDGGAAGLPPWWATMAVVHLLAWLCLAGACIVLPRTWRQTDRSGSGWPVRGRQPRRVPVPSGPASEVLEWLVTRTALVSRESLWMVAGGMVAFLAALDFAQGHVGFEWTSVIMALGLRAAVAVQAARFFATSRSDGSLGLLLITPLSVDELVRGVRRALDHRFAGVAILLVAIRLIPVVLEGRAWSGGMGNAFDAIAGLIVQGLGVVKLLANLLMAAWLGMLLGLVVQRTRWVPALAVLFAVLLPELLQCVPDLLIAIPVAIASRDRVSRELQRLRRGGPGAERHRLGQWNLAITGR